eukprot:TRINITY_DN5936_c0_g3_i1.p1 TRINITY_DN5936_c0_g3~~TRINITY_DN5936_c0_g3_i1.p1  ORF type:complete len:598 (-),score=73.88 TRINITY_DN5936_c0_g3_i1:86-1879(-)
MTHRSIELTGPSPALTVDELDYLTASLKESVASAVAEIVPAEINKLMLGMERALCMLEAINGATAGLSAREGETTRQFERKTTPAPIAETTRQFERMTSPASIGETTRQFERMSSPAPVARVNTLEQVRDQLYLEILHASNSQASPPPERSQSIDRENSVVSPGKSNYVCQPVEEELPEGRNGTQAASASPLSNSRRVVPCATEDHLHDICAANARQRPLTLGVVSTNLQDMIVRKSCSVPSEIQTHRTVMPLLGCILQRGFVYRMGLLLAICMCVVIDVVCIFYYYSEPIDCFIHPFRDVAALIFAIAAAVSSRQLVQGQQHIEHMAVWAETRACSDAWRIVSRRKQRGLLAWWALALLSALSGDVAIIYESAQLEPKGHASFVLLCAREVCIYIVFLMSCSLLFSAAFIQCHIISALEVFIDVWSCELCEQRNFAECMVSWNTVQALIRRAGFSFENVFTVIQTCALLGCMVVAAQGISFALHPDWSWSGLLGLLLMLPLLLLSALAGSLLLQFSCITEKCSFLASLANQIMSDDSKDALDAGRHYLVRFLTASAAGIYVKGVRLDMQMVVNIVYFLAMAASAILGLAFRFSVSS